MTILDGWSHDKWNAKGMFFAESALAAVSAVVFLVLAYFLWPKRSTDAAPVDAALQAELE